MNAGFYDPWAHGVHLVAKRVLRTVLVGVPVGLMVWAVALHALYGDSVRVATSTVTIGEATPELRAVCYLCLILGQALAFWALSAVWLLAGRGAAGRHWRGARIIDGQER